VRFNADEWVQLAEDAGMKYIVITSKHHDGFALYGSKVSKYNIVDATPFKRDVLKELADACARRVCDSGSTTPRRRTGTSRAVPATRGISVPMRKRTRVAPMNKYLREKAEPQVRELLTGYGPVCLIWFDTPRMMTADRGQRFMDIVHSLQPACLIDGRLGTAGDYRSMGTTAFPTR